MNLFFPKITRGKVGVWKVFCTEVHVISKRYSLSCPELENSCVCCFVYFIHSSNYMVQIILFLFVQNFCLAYYLLVLCPPSRAALIPAIYLATDKSVTKSNLKYNQSSICQSFLVELLVCHAPHLLMTASTWISLRVHHTLHKKLYSIFSM